MLKMAIISPAQPWRTEMRLAQAAFSHRVALVAA
jgi:hypothetical protein